jgi:membrane protease subunit HflK
MAWDDEDKGNPWRPGGEKGPADLDAIVRDLQRKLSGLLGGRGGGGQGGGPGRPSISGGLVAIALVVLAGLWALTGFYTIDAAERGIVLQFGRYTETTLPGLSWHWPWPIERVEKVNTNETMRWDYRGSMLTRDENIVIVDLVVQYRRSDPNDFLFHLRNPEDTLKDVTGSAIREIIGKNELDFILTDGRAEIADQTHELLQNTLDSYGTGITVYEVNMQDANFPAEVEESVQDAIKAREDKERRILEAQTYSNDILPKARGAAARQREEAEAYKASAVANAQGESDRFLQILGEYEKAPGVTRERLYLETLEQILANSTKVVLDTGEGGNNLLYLPLDQLAQRRAGGTTERDSDTTNVIPPTSGAPRTDLRLRETR